MFFDDCLRTGEDEDEDADDEEDDDDEDDEDNGIICVGDTDEEAIVFCCFGCKQLFCGVELVDDDEL